MEKIAQMDMGDKLGFKRVKERTCVSTRTRAHIQHTREERAGHGAQCWGLEAEGPKCWMASQLS